MNLQNLTAFPHVPAAFYDARGREVFALYVKATMRLSSGEPHPEPLPVHTADVVFASGAVRYPSDLVPEKNGTDIVCNGSVYAPGGQPAPSCSAELQVGDVRAAVWAFGRRRWERVGDGWRISEPEPFRVLALGMENAFGGRGDLRNPMGRGYFDRTRCGSPEGLELPHLEREAEGEQVRSPGDRPAVAGFAAVAPHWEPRRSLAGTYGETWKRTRAPLMPDDMNVRFWNAAQLVSARALVGGESIVLRNLTPSGRLETVLPRVPVRVRIDDREVRPALDLVVLEPDEDRIALTFRMSIDVTGRLGRQMPKVRIVEKRRLPLGERRER